jgi:hypothetical protein
MRADLDAASARASRADVLIEGSALNRSPALYVSNKAFTAARWGDSDHWLARLQPTSM